MYKRYPKGLKLTPDKEYLVHENMGIAKKLAHKWFNGVCEFDDLWQQACVTLVDCATKFDPNAGAKFSTYAYNCINIVLNNYVQNYNKTVAIPLNKIYKIHRYINMEDGPEKEKYKEESNISDEDIYIYTTYEIVSMDMQIVDDYEDVTNLYEDPKDEYQDLDNRLMLHSVIRSLKSYIPDKTYREIFIEAIKVEFDTKEYKSIAKSYNMKLKNIMDIIEECQHIMSTHKNEFI